MIWFRDNLPEVERFLFLEAAELTNLLNSSKFRGKVRAAFIETHLFF